MKITGKSIPGGGEGSAEAQGRIEGQREADAAVV